MAMLVDGIKVNNPRADFGIEVFEQVALVECVEVVAMRTLILFEVVVLQVQIRAVFFEFLVMVFGSMTMEGFL